MSNLIERKNTADAMERWLYDGEDNRTVREVVYELPSAQPEGKWIRHCKLGVWECDQCGTRFKFPFKQHYFCPNCGADMREGGRNETD